MSCVKGETSAARFVQTATGDGPAVKTEVINHSTEANVATCSSLGCLFIWRAWMIKNTSARHDLDEFDDHYKLLVHEQEPRHNDMSFDCLMS